MVPYLQVQEPTSDGEDSEKKYGFSNQEITFHIGRANRGSEDESLHENRLSKMVRHQQDLRDEIQKK